MGFEDEKEGREGTRETGKRAARSFVAHAHHPASEAANASRGWHKCAYMETGGSVKRAKKKLPFREKHLH